MKKIDITNMIEYPQGNATKERPWDTHTLMFDEEKPHVGGSSIEGDGATYTPNVWKTLIEDLKIESMFDVGCGRGHALSAFESCGIDVLGIDGCREAIEKNLISKEKLILHDFSEKSLILQKQYDLCFSSEFVEHVKEEFCQNFLDTFKCGKYIWMCYAKPGQGGHAHYNENSQEYWIEKIEKNGFKFDLDYSLKLREIAKIDGQKYSPFYEGHFIKKGLFFAKNLI